MKKRLRKRFDLALEETEITGHVLYDARHSYASTILARCRDFVCVSAQLGHASPKPRRIIYAHPIAGRRSELCRCARRIRSGLAVARRRATSRYNRFCLTFWSHPPDSNRRPADYESAALPTELGWLSIAVRSTTE